MNVGIDADEASNAVSNFYLRCETETDVLMLVSHHRHNSLHFSSNLTGGVGEVSV